MVGPSDITRHGLARVVLLAAAIGLVPTAVAAQPSPYPERVEIRRTQYGVPHILADDLAAAFFGLAYCHSEDYGDRVAMEFIRGRGEMGRYFGQDSIESDFWARQSYARTLETYHLLSQDARDALEGYAAGINYYIQLHPEEFPDWLRPDFTGHDAAERWIGGVSFGSIRRFMRRLMQSRDSAQAAPEEEGSNAWAFAPSRTASGHAILVRNPHLNWNAGYYEAHITVPGVINFYGDLRVGNPLFAGGFNENLGWATTNNGPDPDEIYALDVDPERPDHYLFDGTSIHLTRQMVTVEFKNGPGLARETREFWSSPLGPVFHRGGGKIYVIRSAGFGEYRGPEQFLRMMRARSLGEFKAAMRMRAQRASNFTYADRDGNIYYLWNATIPSRPSPSGSDTLALPAVSSADVWTQIVPFGALPQVENPVGGYVHNENDPFHYANLNQVLDSADYPPPDFPSPRLRLRSQHSLELIHNDRVFSLEEIVDLKHSMRMLLADRVKDDLVAAVRATEPAGEVAEAIGLIEAWDNTVAAQSRGGVLFETWFRRYLLGEEPRPGGLGREAWDSAFAHPWTPLESTTTPRGLSDPTKAAEAFVWAVEQTKEQFGAWDIAWGDVHRVRIGDVDVPVGGCSGQLGCFRVLWFQEAEDGKRVAAGGDGWVLAVEFGDQPRAYSILAYGQSSKDDSPHFNDQAELFASNRMKRVAFTEDEIRDQLIRSYRPGEE
jgi:acyl-homoserine-lactone acylase